MKYNKHDLIVDILTLAAFVAGIVIMVLILSNIEK